MVTLKSIQMVCFEMEFGEQSLMFLLPTFTKWKHRKTNWNTNQRVITLKIKTDRRHYTGTDSNFKAIKAGFRKA